VVVASTSACASSAYQPARNPRVTAAASVFSTSYVRDGREFAEGPWSGGLEGAVEGNGRAQEEARTAHTFTVAGFVLEVAGLGALGTGVGLNVQHDEGLRSAGTWVALGGAVAVLTGMVLTATATPHAIDAVNIYNDALDDATTRVADENRPGESRLALAIARTRSNRFPLTTRSAARPLRP
jgi:hypothetical protein